uniref:Uncharacterized protein n=1 Tax=Leptocylindrus danicus TaxID=163516 RepID=A0A7S2L2J0_9STRA|mmetsp:Transcript_3051/g.4415  ORF Transcript_3051/g.4415 Transcript_3051/m.4415 type:complete len:454 (+) Transcript_3051:284-1645(+)
MLRTYLFDRVSQTLNNYGHRADERRKKKKNALRLFDLVSERNWDGLLAELSAHPDKECFSRNDVHVFGATQYLLDNLLDRMNHTPNSVIWATIAADPGSLTQRDIDRFLPLHQACYHGNPEHIRIILEAYPQASMVYAEGRGLPVTCYLTGSFPNHRLSVVDMLLELYPDGARSHIVPTTCQITESSKSNIVNAGDAMYNPILRRAYRNWNALKKYENAIGEDELHAGEGSEESSSSTLSPSSSPALNESWGIIVSILRKRHQLEAEGLHFSPLYAALGSNELRMGYMNMTDLPIDEILTRYAVDVKAAQHKIFHQDGKTPLHLLIDLRLPKVTSFRGAYTQQYARQKHIEALVKLLQINPELVCIPDSSGKLPLHYALERDYDDWFLLRLLTEYDSRVLVTPDYSSRLYPFMIAASRSNDQGIDDETLSRIGLSNVYSLLRMRPERMLLGLE